MKWIIIGLIHIFLFISKICFCQINDLHEFIRPKEDSICSRKSYLRIEPDCSIPDSFGKGVEKIDFFCKSSFQSTGYPPHRHILTRTDYGRFHCIITDSSDIKIIDYRLKLLMNRKFKYLYNVDNPDENIECGMAVNVIYKNGDTLKISYLRQRIIAISNMYFGWMDSVKSVKGGYVTPDFVADKELYSVFVQYFPNTLLESFIQLQIGYSLFAHSDYFRNDYFRVFERMKTCDQQAYFFKIAREICKD